MSVRAKFFVAEVAQYAHLSNYAAPVPAGKVVLRPVSRGEANKEWASATPSGEFTMTIHGDAFPWFQERIGREVSILIDEADEQTGVAQPGLA